MLTALLLLLAITGCGDAPRVTKETIVRLPATWRPGSVVAVDRDVAWLDRVDGGLRVMALGREPGTTWRECARPRIGGRRVATWCTNSPHPPAQISLVVDDLVLATPLGRPGTFVFSRDGERWAAVGGLPARGPSVVWVDGSEAGRWADVSLPAFSDDGTHVAWLAETTAGRIVLVLDGVEHAPLDEPAVPTSPVAKQSKIGPNLSPQLAVRWLPDGPPLVVAQDRDGWSVSRDGERLGSYRLSAWNGESPSQFAFGPEYAAVAAIVPSSLAIAADAPVAAWWERLAGGGERWRVVRDGMPVDDVTCDDHFSAQTPQLSADGTTVAYVCPGQRGATVVVDDRRYGPYATVSGVSLASGRVAWAEQANGAWTYRRDGEALPGHWRSASAPSLDPTGAHVAWEADGALVLDGHRIARFDEKLLGPTFEEPGRVAWVIRRGRRVARVTASY